MLLRPHTQRRQSPFLCRLVPVLRSHTRAFPHSQACPSHKALSPSQPIQRWRLLPLMRADCIAWALFDIQFGSSICCLIWRTKDTWFRLTHDRSFSVSSFLNYLHGCSVQPCPSAEVQGDLENIRSFRDSVGLCQG